MLILSLSTPSMMNRSSPAPFWRTNTASFPQRLACCYHRTIPLASTKPHLRLRTIDFMNHRLCVARFPTGIISILASCSRSDSQASFSQASRAALPHLNIEREHLAQAPLTAGGAPPSCAAWAWACAILSASSTAVLTTCCSSGERVAVSWA